MKAALACFLVGAAISSITAAPFANLDFDSGNTNNVVIITPGYPAGYGKTTDLLPGWTVTQNGVVQARASLNAVVIGFGDGIGIFSREGEGHSFVNFQNIITGKFVLYVTTGSSPFVLSQVGDVPPDVSQLRIIEEQINASNYIRTFLNGTDVSNGDISAFAGLKNVRLDVEIGRRQPPPPLAVPDIAVDRIEFVVPTLEMSLTIDKAPPVNGEPKHVTVRFAVEPGNDYFVEFRDGLGSEVSWQTLPGAPHNSGSVVDFTAAQQRFYRVRSVARSP
jgi:hypothetical protein